MIAKLAIRHNFTRHASRYDDHCRAQQRAAAELLREGTPAACARILDIGCGTGNLTRGLRDRYPDARIDAIDLCPGMVALAQRKMSGLGIDFQVGDAEIADLGGPYDLIASNATFQWLEDLDGAVDRCLSHLRPGGTLLFSTFGPQTYRELAETLRDELGEDLTLTSTRFLDAAEVAACLGARATETRIRQEDLSERHDSLMSLLKTIKYSGTLGMGLAGRTLRRAEIQRLERHYRRRFGAIVATHQLFYCRAKRCAP